MKKLFLIFILFPNFAWGALTQQQIIQVSTTTAAILSTASQINTLVYTVEPLIVNQNTYSLYFSTDTTNLTTNQENDIINYYENLKTNLLNEVNSLP